MGFILAGSRAALFTIAIIAQLLSPAMALALFQACPVWEAHPECPVSAAFLAGPDSLALQGNPDVAGGPPTMQAIIFVLDYNL
jgi:hypothetical protein